ncbi:MAG: hypothetical protein M3Z25_05740 [Actinomycetota bacterium]|nr:hypothetical protein [Actinomycetota bacterium]
MAQHHSDPTCAPRSRDETSTSEPCADFLALRAVARRLRDQDGADGVHGTAPAGAQAHHRCEPEVAKSVDVGSGEPGELSRARAAGVRVSLVDWLAATRVAQTPEELPGPAPGGVPAQDRCEPEVAKSVDVGSGEPVEPSPVRTGVARDSLVGWLGTVQAVESPQGAVRGRPPVTPGSGRPARCSDQPRAVSSGTASRPAPRRSLMTAIGSWFRRQGLLVIVVIVLAVAIGTGALLARQSSTVPAAADTARLTLTTSRVRIGESYSVNASGFAPGEKIKFTWTGPTNGTMGSFLTDQTGTIVNGPILGRDPPGNYVITATGSQSGRSVTAPLQVVAASIVATVNGAPGGVPAQHQPTGGELRGGTPAPAGRSPRSDGGHRHKHGHQGQ